MLYSLCDVFLGNVALHPHSLPSLKRGAYFHTKPLTARPAAGAISGPSYQQRSFSDC